MRYRAFLSYSHADARWARWLLQRLEAYRVPPRLVGSAGAHGPVPARLGPVFRDRDELPSAGDLTDTIRDALAGSGALVVLCSPDAARSRWVDAEIEAFRGARPGAPILCFVVAGDPNGGEDGCFPPALLRPGPDGVHHEPLAADARREGDGRERALVRLVAGLLGVGYDALAQREAQRRHRRLAAVAMAAMAGMAVALALAASAWVARNDAERRQAQAEDLLGFMLGDLRGKLATVGRLDLMRSVDDKATGYFATLDPRDLSDAALEAQARSLAGIGQVRLDEGNHPEAMVAFREAHARSTALRARAPADGTRLFDLAQAEYWIGLVAFKQGRYDDAALWLTRYRDNAVALAAMDPGNFDWQREVAYGHHNLAVLDERRGRLDEAERAMRTQLALYRTWERQRPDDTSVRHEAANIASWLGSLAMRQGRLAQAEAYFAEQGEAIRRNLDDEPDDARWKELQVDALLLLTDARAQRGRLAAARDSALAATAMAAALAAQDPANNTWRVSLGSARWWQARLGIDGPVDASAAAATTLLAQAHAAEPANERVASWLVRALAQQAELALAADRPGVARAHLARAREVLAPVAADPRAEGLRLWRARIAVLDGDLAAHAGDLRGAHVAWNGALALLQPDAAGEVPFARLEPLADALQRLGREDEAARHRSRLAAAGHVSLQVPASARVVASQ